MRAGRMGRGRARGSHVRTCKGRACGTVHERGYSGEIGSCQLVHGAETWYVGCLIRLFTSQETQVMLRMGSAATESETRWLSTEAPGGAE